MTFDRQPTLTGPTLTLRPLTSADRDVLFEAASDPRTWAQHPANRNEPDEFEAFFTDTLASGGALLAIRHDGEAVGTSRFGEVEGNSVEIGWTFVRHERWGDGTNREMKELMVPYAFDSVGRVDFLVADANPRSQRAVEKLGAVRVARRTRAGYVTFELTPEGWAARGGTDRVNSC